MIANCAAILSIASKLWTLAHYRILLVGKKAWSRLSGPMLATIAVFLKSYNGCPLNLTSEATHLAHCGCCRLLGAEPHFAALARCLGLFVKVACFLFGPVLTPGAILVWAKEGGGSFATHWSLL